MENCSTPTNNGTSVTGGYYDWKTLAGATVPTSFASGPKSSPFMPSNGGPFDMMNGVQAAADLYNLPGVSFSFFQLHLLTGSPCLLTHSPTNTSQ